MSDECKPCPWCQNVESSLVEVRRVSPVGGELGYCQQCDACRAHGPWAPSPLEADEEWNRRPTAWRNCATEPPPVCRYVLMKTAVGSPTIMVLTESMNHVFNDWQWCEVPE